ncbi:hypothetical protein NQZ79_g7631 [Umbelopsis isabellina]|nr:hypothetical protein NQZ79_g7631 [Umbelopsis isabellina]
MLSHLILSKKQAFNKASMQCLLAFDDPLVIETFNEIKMGNYLLRATRVLCSPRRGSSMPVTERVVAIIAKWEVTSRSVADLLSKHTILMITGGLTALVWLEGSIQRNTGTQKYSNKAYADFST